MDEPTSLAVTGLGAIGLLRVAGPLVVIDMIPQRFHQSSAPSIDRTEQNRHGHGRNDQPKQCRWRKQGLN
jgi:hypothetical protein